MSVRFDRLEQGSGVLYGTVGGLWVMILVGKPTAPDMLLARPALTSMARREPKGFPTLTWVTLSAGLAMEADARKAAADVTDQFAKSITAQATIVEGAGFQAATVRAILTGLDAMSRSTAPKKTFGDALAAVEWCLDKRPAGGDTAPAPDVARAITLAREGLAVPTS